MDKENKSERIGITMRISSKDRLKLNSLSTRTKEKYKHYKSQSDLIHEALTLLFKKLKI